MEGSNLDDEDDESSIESFNKQGSVDRTLHLVIGMVYMLSTD